MSDYKYAVQVDAEELAWELYGCDFYDLSAEEQDILYNQALGDYFERRIPD